MITVMIDPLDDMDGTSIKDKRGHRPMSITKMLICY